MINKMLPCTSLFIGLTHNLFLLLFLFLKNKSNKYIEDVCLKNAFGSERYFSSCPADILKSRINKRLIEKRNDVGIISVR